MTARQLTDFCQRDPVLRSSDVHVCCVDNIQKGVLGNYIVNTLKSDQAKFKIGHWVAYVVTPSDIFLFDSLALPENRLLLPYTITNMTSVQGENSIACGDFALFYLCFKLRRVSHHSIISMFGRSYQKNEQLITTTLPYFLK